MILLSITSVKTYLPKGWMQPMSSLQMTCVTSFLFCESPQSAPYYCLLNICHLLLFSLNQELLEAEKIHHVKSSQYVSHFLQPFLGHIQKELNGLLVLSIMSILTSLKYVLVCSPQKVFLVCHREELLIPCPRGVTWHVSTCHVMCNSSSVKNGKLVSEEHFAADLHTLHVLGKWIYEWYFKWTICFM